ETWTGRIAAAPADAQRSSKGNNNGGEARKTRWIPMGFPLLGTPAAPPANLRAPSRRRQLRDECFEKKRAMATTSGRRPVGARAIEPTPLRRTRRRIGRR